MIDAVTRQEAGPAAAWLLQKSSGGGRMRRKICGPAMNMVTAFVFRGVKGVITNSEVALCKLAGVSKR